MRHFGGYGKDVASMRLMFAHLSTGPLRARHPAMPAG